MIKNKTIDIENHIIICGWQKKTPQIIKELHAREEYVDTRFVVISDRKDFENLDLKRRGLSSEGVILCEGDFTDPAVLRSVNIEKASTSIILPDWSRNRSSRDIDARTVLTALTIEKLNPNIYSCAELLDLVYESHMRMGKVDQVIRGGYFSGLITAQAAIDGNLIPYLKKFLPADSDHDFQNIPLPAFLIDQEFGTVLQKLRYDSNTLPVGVKTEEGKLIINPENYILKPGDILVGFVNRKKNNSKQP